MSGVSAPVVWAIVIVLAGGWLYHAVTEHHYHLVLLKVIRPKTVVPATTHDSKWHAASHPRRLLVNAMLTGAAILAGLAWELSPYVMAILATVASIIFAGLLIARARDRARESRPVSWTERNGS